LDDLLETEKLLGSNLRVEKMEKPHIGHNYLNYHARAFEKVDHYMHNVLAVLSDPPSFFQR
jgi:hypothetical protein